MSTTAIRLVLKAAALATHENGEMTPDIAEALRDAEREVEAIERAARELLGIWGYARHDIEAEKTMESIAKDAP